MKVVPASEPHLPEIVEIWTELMDYHQALDHFYSRRSDGHVNFEKYARESIGAEDALVLVVLEGDDVVAYSISRVSKHPPVLETEDYGLITDMAVASGHRGEGAGKRMLSEIVSWFESRGIERVELHVAAGNDIGLSFWKSGGFNVYEHVLVLNIVE